MMNQRYAMHDEFVVSFICGLAVNFLKKCSIIYCFLLDYNGTLVTSVTGEPSSSWSSFESGDPSIRCTAIQILSAFAC